MLLWLKRLWYKFEPPRAEFTVIDVFNNEYGVRCTRCKALRTHC